MDPSLGGPVRPGARFGNLDVHEVIGRGAFSTVYRAEDTLLHRQVALKVVDTSRIEDSARAREGILREARMVAKLSSPHVVTLHQVHELQGNLWAFEMEYLAGGSLTERIEREGALTTHEARRVLQAVLRALEVAHASSIVHHDIKPANVLLGSDGSIKLTDFGLGRITSEEEMASGERHRARGTPYYMAPEVVMGLPAIPSSDLWSVGVLLYRMLSGRLPFPARTLPALFLEIQNALPAPLGGRVSPYLASIALRCLAKAPQDRPRSAAELLGELGRQTETSAIPDVGTITMPPRTALVGRDAELKRFRGWANDAQEGHGRTVLLLGEPGIGKTALATEVGREIRARDFRWIEARLSPLDGLRRPLLDALQRCLEREAEASGSDGSSESSVATGRSLSASTVEILERLRRAEDSDAREEILRSTWEIEQMLTTISKERPLVVLIEDVHTCAQDEIRTLAGLSTSLASSRVLLILTWRTKDPDASDSSKGLPSGYYDLIALRTLVRIEIEGLPDADIRTLVEEAAGVPHVTLDILGRILEAAEGVPLYALALYRHLKAVGEIETVDGMVQPTGKWGLAPPPRFIREMVTQRLERLGEEERLLLETASVAGPEFDGNVLAGLVGLPLLTTLRRLQRLYRDRALVEPLGRGFRFAHALYREAIYADLAPDLRRALHRAYAEAIMAGPDGDSADPESLGWHWEQAGSPERAAGPLRVATNRAVRRGELDRAWDLASRSGVFEENAAPDQLREDLDVLLSLGTRLGSRESVESLRALHQRLLAAADELHDDEMRRRTLVAVGWDTFIRRGAGEVDAAAIEDAAENVEHDIARLEALWLLANLARDRQDSEAARELLRAAEAILAPGRRPDLQQSLEHVHALMLRSEGDLEEAARRFTRGAAIRMRMEGSVHAAITRCMELMTRVELGELDAAFEMEEPIRAMERGRQQSRAALARVFQSNLLQAAGDAHASSAALRRAEPMLLGGAFRSGIGALLIARLRREILRGAVEDARGTLAALEEDQGREKTAGHPMSQARWAFLDLIDGNREEAQRRARLALEGVSARPQRLERGEVLLSLAELALLGLDLTDLAPELEPSSSEGLPHFLALSLDVLRGALSPNDPTLLMKGATAAADARVGHRQAETAVMGMFLRVRAHLLAGETEEASTVLEDARQRARELEHLWLELHAHSVAKAAGLPEANEMARSLDLMLRERNPANPDRAAAYLECSWATGGLD